MLAAWGFATPKELVPKAKEAALKALEIDRSLTQVYATLGWINMRYEYNWEEAESKYQQAIALNPNYVIAHLWYGGLLGIIGSNEKATSEIEKALELDPLLPIANWAIARHYVSLGAYQNAIDQLHKLLQIDADFRQAHMTLYRVYFFQKKWYLAFQHFKQWELLNGEELHVLESVYETTGWDGVVNRVIDSLESRAKKEYISPMTMAELHMLLEDHNRALDYLEEGYFQRDSFMASIGNDIRWRPLYSNLRFKAVLEKMRLPKVSG
jgi:serine/threonine-protein kinase